MANERGSIKISTANEIGTALVAKLGGSGYAPNDWDKMINLLGIAREDANPALSVLSDSSGIGTERGSILLSKANSIGAMLNKKYYTSDGFAPKRWASAISKLKALTTNTASGSVIAITDGADDMELLNYEATIPARLDPVPSIHVKRTGKNIIDNKSSAWENGTINSSGDNASGSGTRTIDYYSVKGGATITISGIVAPSTTSDFRIFYYDNNKDFISYRNYSASYILPDNVRYIRIRNVSVSDISSLQIEYGSSATSYEEFITPVTYEASLGRSIYGGSANLITGEGKVNVNRVQIKDLSWTYYTSGTNPIFYAGNVTNMKTYARGEMPNIAIGGYTKRTAHSRSYLSSNMADMECSAIENAQTITFRNDSYTSREAMLEAIGDEYIVYETTTEESFTFDPITIKTMEGNNDFWVNEGDSGIEYYQKPTAYTRATLSGNIVNFSNGRIDLPLTKAKLNIPANILGKNSAVLNRGGKNFLKPSIVFSTPGIYTYNINGSVTVLKSDDRLWTNIPSLSIKAGTYVINNPNGRIEYALASENYQRIYGITSASGTITIASEDSIKIKFGLGASYPFTAYYQLELGSTPTTFQIYSAPSRFISNMGSMNYGGFVEIVSGTGTRINKVMTISEMGFTKSSDYFQVSRDSIGAGDITNDNIISSIYPRGSSSNDKVFWYTSTYIRFRDSDFTTVEQMEEAIGSEKFSFPSNTPIDFTFEPKIITCRSGVNNFYKDESGEIEIEYYVAE